MNCKPIFSFSIDMKLSDKGVAVGKYDAINPSLTAITQSNKIIIHSPNTRYNMFNTQKAWSEIKKDIGMLSVNYTITSIATGKLSDSEKEYLAIGTETNILVYQVDDNIEVFFKDVTEKVTCMTIGSVDITLPPLLLVGSSATVKGYNIKGDEILWIVISGIVNSIILFDFNRDNDQEIILGCNDKIRIYKQDNFIKELNENAAVKQIAPLGTQLLAFILKNGTVGVYEEHVRLWRIKSKTCATCLASYDLLGTGSLQIILGWESGKIDIRDPRSGDVLMKLISPNKVVGLIVTNYRGPDEKDDLICVTEQGEVQGYTSSNVNLAPLTATESNQIKELLAMKQKLMLELTHYENNSKVNELIGTGAEDSVVAMNALKSVSDDFAVIPANTRLQIAISTDGTKQSSVEIGISVNCNSTIIKAVIIFADGIFPNGNETLIVHPPVKRAGSGSYSGINSRVEGVSSIIVPLKIPKDDPLDVHIKAFVGSPDGNQYHVFELNRQLPRFSMYSLPERIAGSPKGLSDINRLSEEHMSKVPESYVKFRVTERVNRFCLFINQNFLLPADIEPNSTETDTFDYLKVFLISLRDSSPLILTFYNDSNILIQTDNIELAGNLIQAMAQFMNVTNLESVASFPSVVARFRESFDKLQGLQESSNVLKTDTALKINLAKILVLRAEDAKVTNIDKLSSYYNELMITNEELMTSFKIRHENYNEVQKLLTDINQTLYHAQRLRVGNPASKMMSSYKEALEQKNIEKLVQIMEISG